MKPPPFTYHAPRTVHDATALLAKLENAKILAGGQSLMPMLNLRYVLPDHIVDINRISELSGITLTGRHARFGINDATAAAGCVRACSSALPSDDGSAEVRRPHADPQPRYDRRKSLSPRSRRRASGRGASSRRSRHCGEWQRSKIPGHRRLVRLLYGPQSGAIRVTPVHIHSIVALAPRLCVCRVFSPEWRLRPRRYRLPAHPRSFRSDRARVGRRMRCRHAATSLRGSGSRTSWSYP